MILYNKQDCRFTPFLSLIFMHSMDQMSIKPVLYERSVSELYWSNSVLKFESVFFCADVGNAVKIMYFTFKEPSN